MSWDKIDNHLFEKYCVEGEDKEFCNLMEEHDKEVGAKAIDEFAEKLKAKAEEIMKNPDISTECKKCAIWKVSDIDNIAEQLKAGGKNE